MFRNGSTETKTYILLISVIDRNKNVDVFRQMHYAIWFVGMKL